MFCDAQGKLSLSAVAEHVNGIQLAEMVKEGLEIELLSHKMDIEEPTAASTISQALNVAQEVALRTSELTAISVLKGEMIVQMGKDLSQALVYKNVIDKVRRELPLASSEPDMPDAFDFLRSLGVGKNSYVDKLLQFGAAFVDSKKRPLRFSAFAVINKVNHDYPLSRVAIVKRAYRKEPHNTFCTTRFAPKQVSSCLAFPAGSWGSSSGMFASTRRWLWKITQGPLPYLS